MAFEWTEAMSTGVEALDNEHRTLIAWVNRLEEATAAGRAEGELLRVLAFLGTYAKQHFAHEEACFLSHQCPHSAANRTAHEAFVATFTRIKADCEARGVTEAKARELHAFRGDWLVSHILNVDTALKPCVK
ncbi:MAG: hemerythrin family protein [Gemmatimonadetes bacterium]|nr:hemerythrin family protein [Gemmatimonadota bacterium]